MMSSKRSRVFYVVLSVIASIVVGGCRTTVEQHSSRYTLQEWEYAQLQHATHEDTADQRGGKRNESWLWITSTGERKSSHGLFAMHKQLADRSPGQMSVLSLLRLAGKDGWELVDYHRGEQELNDTDTMREHRGYLHIGPEITECEMETWIFKRPKK